MNYIGEIVKKAIAQEINVSELFFCQSNDVSPWYEQSFSSLNQKEIDNNIIEINALYRYPEIFSNILNKELIGYDEFRHYIYDISIHFLCELELYGNLMRDDFYLVRLENEIIDGVYGKVYGNVFNGFNYNNKKNMIDFIYHELHAKDTLTLFRRVIRTTYPSALLYQMKAKPSLLILYLGMKQTNKATQKVNFIIDMFLPLGFDMRIFWGNHFGVFGVDAAMEFGEIELF